MRHRRKRLLLATVNARSLASDARLAEFESAASKIKSDIIGVSEVKRSGQGRLDLQSGYSLYYCGNSDGRTHGGVGFYVPTSLVPRIRPFFHSDRILELIIRLPLGHTLRLLQVYAPQSGLGDEQYEDFLALLGRVISDRPNRQLVILGDFNATIGSKEEGEQFIGQHAKGQERNDHGSQLAAFCEESRLHAANTYFKKRAGRKWTLRCNLGFKKEIDYVLVRNIKAVQDVSVLNAFNINSDHRLLRCRLHLKWLPKKVIPKRGAPVVGLHLLAANASPELLSFQSSGSTEADYDKITNIINRATSAESFECVTVFFSDVVSFTALASRSTPLQVVTLLNALYSLFDETIGEHDVYKVETIGDGYLCVSGLPHRNGNEHARHIADMSLGLIHGLQTFSVPHLPAERISLRIGVHTGGCVAGVVGLAMPRYCLFGDTINTASRMESNGKPNKIQLSSEANDFLTQKVGGFITQSRGDVIIKGKGVMETFWLVGHEHGN